MVLVFLIRMSMVFVRIWVFKIQCTYRYYSLTMPVWGPIFDNICMVLEKSPYEYGVPYMYSGAHMHMVIFRIWVLTYIC